MNTYNNSPRLKMIHHETSDQHKKKVDLKFALYLLIAFLPIELIGSIGFLTVSKILGYATLFFFMLSLLSHKKTNLDLASKYFIVFFFYCMLSISWSNYQLRSLAKAFTIIQIIALYIIIINEIDSKKSLNTVMILSNLGGALLGISGLMEINQMKLSNYRVAGFAGNANIYFIMVIFLIPSLYWSIRYSKYKLIKLFSLSVMFVLFYTSLFTESIGGAISLAVFFILYFLFSKKKLLVFLMIVIIIGLVIYLAPGSFWIRFSEIGQSSTDRFSVLWPAGWQAFLSNFFIGHGIGTSDLVLPNFIYTRNFERISVHNSLLAVGIDLGIIGIVLYLLVIFIPTIEVYKFCCVKKASKRTDLENFGVILFCVLIAYLASWFKSGGFEYFKYLWVLVGLETCVVNMIKQEKHAAT